MIVKFLKTTATIFCVSAVLLPSYLFAKFRHPELSFENLNPEEWPGPSGGLQTTGATIFPADRLVSDMNAILQAPLFSQNRVPFEVLPPQAEPDLSVNELPEPVQQSNLIDHKALRLLGVLLQLGKQHALISTPETPTGEWLAASDHIGGWRIVSIDDNRVILEASGNMVEIQQYVDKPNDELAPSDNNQ